MKKLIGLLALVAAFAHGATLNPVQLLNPAGSTSGQAIVSTGSSSAPAWGGIGVNGIAAIAANTVIANATGSAAPPTSFAMPSCSTSTSALQWVSGTGFTCYANSAATTGTLAQFAATTSAQLAGVISDETGTGALVFGTSPTIGGTLAASAITASSTITPSQTAGIVGTTTSNNANAGSVGEYVTANATSVAITTGVPTNITTISLTAGDWDVSGTMQVSPAGGTVVGGENVSISTTSGSAGGLGFYTFIGATKATGQADVFSTPVVRLSLASTTTVYLVGNVSYTTSTLTVSGLIRARRVR